MVDKTAQEERQEILIALHRYDKWDERLLSDVLFGKVIETVLGPRERFVLEMLVEGKSERYITKVLKRRSPQQSFGPDSLSSMKSTIKRKLRDGFETRLPGWIRGKKWHNEKEEHDVRDFYAKHPEFLVEEE